jgi:hypothetical protein
MSWQPEQDEQNIRGGVRNDFLGAPIFQTTWGTFQEICSLF